MCGKYVAHLLTLGDEDIPKELKDAFNQFRLDMTVVKENCKAQSLREAIHLMNDSEVNDVVARILGMHEVLVHQASLELLSPLSKD